MKKPRFKPAHKTKRQIIKKYLNTHFVIVPSISLTTTKSVLSHRKILAVHATTPVRESEKVMVLGPGLRGRDF